MSKNSPVLLRVCIMVVVLAVLLATPFGSSAGDSVKFEYGFKEGVTHDYKAKFNQQTYFGNYSSSLFADLEITEKCIGVTEDGKFQMEIVFNKAEVSTMFMEKMQETSMGEELTGQSVGFLMDAHGNVDEIKPMGYLESWRQIEGAISALINGLYTYLPGVEIAEGEGWKHEETKDNDGTQIVSNDEYKFEGIEEQKGRKCAKIKAEINTGISGTNSTPGGDFDMEGEGKGKYEAYFDGADGLIVKMKFKTELDIDMTPVGGGDAVETTVTYEIEKELL